MAVYTEVSFDEAAAFLNALNLGQLQNIKGAAGGIENTNYFVDTDQGQYVLTLFERLSFEQLPFYLHLMRHLAAHGIPVPDPAGDTKGNILHELKGKPASVVSKLRGHSELAPTAAHCTGVGEALARMHLAGLDYPRRQPNLRGLEWWNETVPVVLPHLTPEQSSLILGELAYQNHVAASSACRSLPQGVVHADLFRDNVMFEDGKLTGFFDFYFAGCDTFLFDIAVCLNDWCIDLATGAKDDERSAAFLAAYQAVRPLTAQERQLLPAMQRAGALRFWLSRLWDLHLPREAAVLKAHDPSHFERVLRERLAQPYLL
ncbi:homoserine kinase, Neisseria type [Polaromonas sp. CF318]|uniref:homoserine kinase n=1 Tax=Polaromonas sp. CF318 TaxID=1144318 RepID=UPI000271089D|nr:homoserine kinase [Polaromonas sp. CF318]EJL86240.1 homoserine kinase, Neisseria type [Polaromonas sp. CF318]